MATKLKTISVRLPDEQYEIISRLSELTGQSRNSFFQEIMEQAAPTLRQMLEVLDHAQQYKNPGEAVGRLLSVAGNAVTKVQGQLDDERPLDRRNDDAA